MRLVTLCCVIAVIGCGNRGPSKASDKMVFIDTDASNAESANADEADDYVAPETCGDGELQAAEACDQSVVPLSCADLGRGSGEVTCAADCRIDISACEIPNSCDAAWCDGEIARSCDADGNVVATDCAGTGDRCAAGTCVSGCDAAAAMMSSEGCQFVGMQLPNSQGGPDSLFVAVNPGPGQANVTFTDATNQVTDSATIAPGQWAEFWVEVDGAVVQIDSDNPISVVQFNAPGHGASQDSTLLFPVHSWGNSTTVSTWYDWDGSFYAALSADGGMIESADGSHQASAPDAWYVELDSDPTATKVTSDVPTMVIGGHTCTAVITSYCDHLEHALFSDDLLGTDYVVGPILENDASVPQAVKVVALQSGTTVTLADGQTATLGAGESHTFLWEEGSDGTAISADKPISVVQVHGASRSPSMVALPGADRWRTSYTVVAPIEEATVQVIAPRGTNVDVNGIPVSGWSPLGSGDFDVAHVPLRDVATLTADQPFQAIVYGFYSYASFMHLAGFGSAGL